MTGGPFTEKKEKKFTRRTNRGQHLRKKVGSPRLIYRLPARVFLIVRGFVIFSPPGGFSSPPPLCAFRARSSSALGRAKSHWQKKIYGTPSRAPSFAELLSFTAGPEVRDDHHTP